MSEHGVRTPSALLIVSIVVPFLVIKPSLYLESYKGTSKNSYNGD